jgi:hypothetical protein
VTRPICVGPLPAPPALTLLAPLARALALLMFLAIPTSGQIPERISLSGLFYLTYENGRDGGESYNQFFVNRAYLTTRVNILPRLTARLTLDTSQDKEGDGQGDMEVRIKYAYAEYDLGSAGPLTELALEGGIVHMVWLDFEEHLNLYRMRDPMFMERSGMFNSADFGLTLSGGLGGSLPEDYQREVSSSYAARYGSFALGLYNGGGYHAEERNEGKVLQGRLTLRPLSDALPGFQLSGLAMAGKGNQPGAPDEIPDWRVFNVLASYQHARGALSAQYAWGEGNQKGTWTEPERSDLATDYSGYSLFGEHRLGSSSAWRLVAGYDRLERTPGSLDRSFHRIHAGIGYDLGGDNILLLDFDRREWDDAALPVDDRVQVVLQVKW